MSSPVLLDIGSAALAHQAQVDELKRILGINHNYFDCWLFNFLENKNFKMSEAVAKLQRREEFERTELANAEITDWMMENMQKGIIQVIGNDKAGRVAFYITTVRDKPQSKYREESRKNFDMFVSYGTRLRAENKRCQITMLINQDKASMTSNLDMTFQADIALRIAKYYPGCVDKMYICNMGKFLSYLAKPIFAGLPAIVSDRIIIISDGDIKKGKLLDLFDRSVLPTTLGGDNDCDKQENYTRFAYTIKEYFEQLKAAVKRGMTVKEWELVNLRAAHAVEDGITERLHQSMFGDSQEPNSALAHMEGGNPSWSTGSMISVRLGDMHAHSAVHSDDSLLVTCSTPKKEASLAERGNSSMLGGRGDTMRHILNNSIFRDSVSQCATMETFFRISLAEISDQEWLRIVQLEIKERSELLEQADQFSSESFLLSLPPIMQVVVRGFLWICLTVMSFFFLIGTFFIALVGVLSSLYIFFCMFSKPYYVFLYGTAFIVVAVQFTLFCSRGFDIARNTFNGRLIQALKAFGSKALIFQGVIYVGCTVGCFVVFCVMATRFDVLTGIQYSVAYGWVVAVCLTFIYHVAFAFGFKEISKRSYSSGSRVNNAETTLYLFMDIDMDDAHLFRRAPSEVILLSFLGVLAFASGVSFMAGGSFFFLTGAIVMTAAVLFLSVIVLSTNNSSPSATLTICSVFYGCIFWMGAVFTMSREGWHNNYGDALLATLFVMLFFVISCFVSTYGPWKGRRRRWLFRMAWLLLLSHLVACVVALIVYNYRMGLFVMALALHLLVCIFRTNEASNVYGVCLMATGFVFALLACCLIANYDHQQIYSGSASGSLLPSFASSVIDDSSETSSVFPPICTTRFAKSSLDIVSMALFSKMSYNSDLTSMEKDMNTWFPDFTSVTSLDQGVNDVLKVTMFRRRASSMNTTILSVRTGENLLQR
ncbi:hypothetical protein STCU_06672 [Strigomonas culicis]|uniref:CRAL-TRIO domain-containing protein n=1 Tax=Strigomonas culicis TaxID=28005 RepID=S9VEP9_9TRYP|nr:hypothetical protein STCU_06672 [Strigomonas culicis]|eukprot:EPY25571.1 hypothetical protein STCU_06672 [Strigomonas culicis]